MNTQTLSQRYNVNDVNELGFAVHQGNYEKTLSLIKKGIDINCIPSLIERFDIEKSSWLIEKNKYNKTILMLALNCRLDSLKYREKIVTTLVKHGANVMASDTAENDTPLHYAALRSMYWRKSHLPFRLPCNKAFSFNFHYSYWESIDNCIEILLKAGSDPNIKNKYGNTPLHCGCLLGMSASNIKKLIEHGANIHAKNNFGATPLHMCFSGENGPCYSMHHSVNDGLYIVSPENCHFNHELCCYWKALCTTLIAYGANINAQDNDGYTPLYHWLCSNSQFCRNSSDRYSKTSIRFFLKNKADINIHNNKKESPLHYACWSCHTDAIKMLIEAGANVNSLTSDYKTPLDLALEDSVPWEHNKVYDRRWGKAPKEKKKVEKILRKAGGKRGSELPQKNFDSSDFQSIHQPKSLNSDLYLNIIIIIGIVALIFKSCSS